MFMISLREVEQMLLSTVTGERMETQKLERSFPHVTRQQKDVEWTSIPLSRTHTGGGQEATKPEWGSLSWCLWALYPPLGPVVSRGTKATEGTHPGAGLRLLLGHSIAHACCLPGKKVRRWTQVLLWLKRAGLLAELKLSELWGEAMITQALEPQIWSSNHGSATYYLWGFGQLTSPLWAPTPIL